MSNIYEVARKLLNNFEQKVNQGDFPFSDPNLPSLKYWCYYAELHNDLLKKIPLYDENKNEIVENIKCLEELDSFNFSIDAYKSEDETLIDIKDYLNKVRENNKLFINYNA